MVCVPGSCVLGSESNFGNCVLGSCVLGSESNFGNSVQCVLMRVNLTPTPVSDESEFDSDPR